MRVIRSKQNMLMRPILWLLLLIPFQHLHASGSDYPETAQATIEKVFTELFADLEGLLEIYDESPEAFYSEVDRVVSPWIDYESFSRGVMGRKYFTQASDEQRVRFQNVFKESLVQTYGKSLLGIDEPDFEIDSASEENSKPNSTQVRQTLFSGTGRVVVVYSMGLSEEGRWQLRNVILEGINLGKTFRSQFARSAQEYSEDLDKVIDNWSSEV